MINVGKECSNDQYMKAESRQQTADSGKQTAEGRKQTAESRKQKTKKNGWTDAGTKLYTEYLGRG